MLNPTHISLRKLSPKDAPLILKWENNPDNWEVSNTVKKFTEKEIEEFVNQTQDIKQNNQLRLMICLGNESIGCIDLFEYDSTKQQAGVGILIADKVNRNKGFAEKGLNQLIKYCRNELSIVHLFCNILKDNTPSIRLFEKCGFTFVNERELEGQAVNYYKIKC